LAEVWPAGSPLGIGPASRRSGSNCYKEGLKNGFSKHVYQNWNHRPTGGGLTDGRTRKRVVAVYQQHAASYRL
jgi:hypothetical protein